MSSESIAVSRPDRRGTGRTAVLARANPISKLGGVFLLTIALVLTVDWVSAGIALVCELVVLPLAGVSLRTLLLRGWPLLAAAVVGGYGTALLAADSGAVVLEWGFISFSEGSLAAGVAIMLRGLAIALPGIIILASTDPTDLADALAQKLRLPHRFVLGALAAMRLVGLLLAEWQVLGMARRARGVSAGGGYAGRIKASLGQSLALLVQAIRKATRLAMTMEARGFGGAERTWARQSRYSRIDLWVACGSVLVTVLAVGSAVAAGTWNPVF
ncbi:energy-coupling factor transporter transmembrane component T family protein [Arthrobacter pigmenti]